MFSANKIFLRKLIPSSFLLCQSKFLYTKPIKKVNENVKFSAISTSFGPFPPSFESIIFKIQNADDSDSLKLLHDIISKETNPANVRHYIILCSQRNFWHKLVFNLLIKQLYSLPARYDDVQDVTKFWSCFFPITKNLDNEDLSMSQDIYDKGYKYILSKDQYIEPHTLNMIVKLGQYLSKDYEELMKFVENNIFQNYKKFTWKQLIFFFRDINFLESRFKNIKLEENLFNTLITHINNIKGNKEIFQFLSDELNKVSYKYIHDREFIEIIIVLTKMNIIVQPLIEKTLQIYVDKISLLSDDLFRKTIINLCNLKVLNPYYHEITKKEFIRRMEKNTIELHNALAIFRTLSSRRNTMVSGINPSDEFFLCIKTYLLKHLDKMTSNSIASVLALFAYAYYINDMVFISNLFNNLKETKLNLLPDDMIGLLLRAVVIYQHYDPELWKMIEEKLLAERYQAFFASISKNNALMANRIAELTLGIQAVILEKPEIIINKEIFGEFFQRLRVFYQDLIQSRAVEKYSPYEMSTFAVFHIIKALNLNPIPEQMVSIFNIDIYIPHITIELLDQIEKNMNLEQIVEEINSLLDNPEAMESQAANDRKLAKLVINENIKDSLLIEIHGPSHYFGDEKYMKGGSILKERLLNKIGSRLLIIKQSECIEFRQKISRRQIIHDIIQKLKGSLIKNE